MDSSLKSAAATKKKHSPLAVWDFLTVAAIKTIVEAYTSVQLNVNKIMRIDLSAADFLIPETSYRVYCFAEDNWPTDAISASVRSQSYGSHPSMPNKVSLEDVLNFSSAGMF